MSFLRSVNWPFAPLVVSLLINSGCAHYYADTTPAAFSSVVKGGASCPAVSGRYDCDVSKIVVFEEEGTPEPAGESQRAEARQLLDLINERNYSVRPWDSDAISTNCTLIINQNECSSLSFTINVNGTAIVDKLEVEIIDYDDEYVELDEQSFDPHANAIPGIVIGPIQSKMELYRLSDASLLIQRIQLMAGIVAFPVPFIPVYHYRAHWLQVPSY